MRNSEKETMKKNVAPAPHSPVTELNELCVSNHWPMPRYEDSRCGETLASAEFTVTVSLSGFQQSGMRVSMFMTTGGLIFFTICMKCGV